MATKKRPTKRTAVTPAIRPRPNPGRPASIGITIEQKERIYAAAQAAGYRIQFGPNSQLGAFIDHLIDLAEAEPEAEAARADSAPALAAQGYQPDPEQAISLTPAGEARAGIAFT